MARLRSPNFPAIPLGQAVSFTEKIFSNDRTNAIEKVDAAKHMGYSGLTGRTLKLLGALSQYGLLDKVGKGRVRVSKTFVSIRHGLTADERREALALAGRSPVLFQRIRDAFPEEPSERSITSFLMQQGFTDSAIAPVLRSYRETNLFLAQEGVTESYGDGAEEGPDSESFEEQEERLMPEIRTTERGGVRFTPPPPQQPDPALFLAGGPLDFNLSSHGLAVVGKTKSAKELKAFIETLQTLLPLLPEAPKDEPDAGTN
jgi:hypothetical protein